MSSFSLVLVMSEIFVLCSADEIQTFSCMFVLTVTQIPGCLVVFTNTFLNKRSSLSDGHRAVESEAGGNEARG